MDRKPDYSFYFDNPDAKAIGYSLWVTPNHKQIELIEGDDRYTKLSEKNASTLFSIFEIE